MHKMFGIFTFHEENLKAVILMLLWSLFVLTGCREVKEVLVTDIPDAENSCFTDDGRLFITGGENVYEINKTGTDGFIANPIFKDEDGNLLKGTFGGIVQHNDTLYAIGSKIKQQFKCADLQLSVLLELGDSEKILQYLSSLILDVVLYKANLRDPSTGLPDKNLRLMPVHNFDNIIFPNGMAIDSTGYLYIADFVFAPYGKIMRVDTNCISCGAEPYLSFEDGVTGPNGITVKGDCLYFTDLDIRNLSRMKRSVKKADITTRIVTPPIIEKCGLSAFDDLTTGSILGMEIIVVTDFFKGQLLFISDDDAGNLLRTTTAHLLDMPSSVIFGAGDFEPLELIVTEKGVPLLNESGFGNKLSKFYFKQTQW
jgi:hypothetical protein